MKDYSATTDEELLREYHLEKNPRFLNIIFSRYTDVGFRTAMRYMRNSSDAEDVLQLAFIQFLQNLHTFREGSTTIKPWLMKMIVNASICKLREEKQRSHRQQKVASQKFQQHQGEEKSAEMPNDKEALKEKIQSCVDSLPEKYRSPIWMVLYEGFSYPEVASVLALPEKTVRTQVARGLEKLRQTLGSFGSVLSINTILILMAESNLEMAPLSLKAIITSPEFYQSASSKIIKSGSFSQRNLASTSSKNLFFSFKFLIALATLGLAVISGFYFFDNQKSNTSTNSIIQSKPILPETEKTANEDTNRTWTFTNKHNQAPPLLQGEWEWIREGMVAPVNKVIIISLPILSQQKPFMIECFMTGASAKESPGLNFTIKSCWVKEMQLLKHENFVFRNKFYFEGSRNKIVKTYFYMGHICYFVDNKLIQIEKYSEDLNGANVSLVSRNYIYQKIKSTTLDSPPDELLKAIESLSTQTGRIFNSMNLNETAFGFRN